MLKSGVGRWNESHPLSDDSVRYLRRGYFAATSFMDAQMGLVLDALDAAGPAIADNTITVLCEASVVPAVVPAHRLHRSSGVIRTVAHRERSRVAPRRLERVGERRKLRVR